MNNHSVKIEGAVIALVHDHWVTSLKPFLMFLIGWIIFGLILYVGLELAKVNVLFGSMLLIVDFAMLMAVNHFAFIFLFELEISGIIVTTEQLIEMRYVFLIRDDILSNEISQIHSIEKEKHGMIKNILNYGDVSIFLAGKGQGVHLKYICNPTEFVSLLQTIKHKKLLADINFKSMSAICSKGVKNLTW